MSITLDAVTLSNDLVWADQYTWCPVVQTSSFAVDGSLIIEVGTKLKGRKISLVGESNVGWMTRSVMDAIYAKVATAGLVMTLTYKGTPLNVMFDHEQGALNVEQAMGYSDPNGTDWIKVNSINFLVV